MFSSIPKSIIPIASTSTKEAAVTQEMVDAPVQEIAPAQEIIITSAEEKTVAPAKDKIYAVSLDWETLAYNIKVLEKITDPKKKIEQILKDNFRLLRAIALEAKAGGYKEVILMLGVAEKLKAFEYLSVSGALTQKIAEEITLWEESLDIEVKAKRLAPLDPKEFTSDILKNHPVVSYISLAGWLDSTKLSSLTRQIQHIATFNKDKSISFLFLEGNEATHNALKKGLAAQNVIPHNVKLQLHYYKIQNETQKVILAEEQATLVIQGCDSHEAIQDKKNLTTPTPTAQIVSAKLATPAKKPTTPNRSRMYTPPITKAQKAPHRPLSSSPARRKA